MAWIERNENHAVVVGIVEAGLIKTPSEKVAGTADPRAGLARAAMKRGIRTSFAPETTRSKHNKRARNQTKTQQNQPT
jgi:hypothetical protein